MLSLFKNTEMKRVMNAVAAGTTTQNGASVKMDNAESVLFVAAVGAITAGAVTALKAQQSDDDGSTDDWTDLEGSSVAIADDDDDQIVPLEIVRPTKAYVRPVLVRGTQNAVIDGIIAIKHGLRKAESTHDATTVVAGKSLVGPTEGTA